MFMAVPIPVGPVRSVGRHLLFLTFLYFCSFPSKTKKLSFSRRIKLFPPDHFFADPARFPKRGLHLRIGTLRRFAQQPLKFLVKEIADEFRRVTNRRPLLVDNFDTV